jgi:hypothetical protein
MTFTTSPADSQYSPVPLDVQPASPTETASVVLDVVGTETTHTYYWSVEREAWVLTLRYSARTGDFDAYAMDVAPAATRATERLLDGAILGDAIL